MNTTPENLAPAKEFTLAEMNAALVEVLKQDKASLDWLEKQEGLTTCGFRFKWFNDSGITLREAIRREMEKEKVASVT